MKHSRVGDAWIFTETESGHGAMVFKGTETQTFYDFYQNNPHEFTRDQHSWLSKNQIGDWDPPAEYHDPKVWDELTNQDPVERKHGKEQCECKKQVVAYFGSAVWRRQKISTFDGKLLQNHFSESVFERLVGSENVYLELAKDFVESGYSAYYAGRAFEQLRKATDRVAGLERVCVELESKYQESLKFQKSLQEQRVEQEL
ncbi:hypothetical protein FKW77_007194 [Venturia effusa]|uniref:Uncharacterized protein n=1 Tax=Venturia effusa TaxID=50376 RepID=A0A517LNA4_9PEZI|nr:hypothetical protein FKW77_007194 [Venturia effusa]